MICVTGVAISHYKVYLAGEGLDPPFFAVL